MFKKNFFYFTVLSRYVFMVEQALLPYSLLPNTKNYLPTYLFSANSLSNLPQIQKQKIKTLLHRAR